MPEGDNGDAPESVTITVDGRTMVARPGEMLIAAAERHGVYIPRFCYHPRMKPVGMCRMCLVEINGPKGFSLMPACYVPVKEDQEVITDSPKVKKAQDGVLEFLLINHPLDCPVCDRGGECPLQDQTFAFGPGESRFVEEKRHWAKPIPINPLVALDRERCIQCARCTRFADEVAGDPMIDFVGRADQIEVGTFYDRPFVSNFSGNVVQICPVGALTATPYRFRARPWDLETVESTCTACAVGCRMALQSSADRLIRHLGLDSDPVNHGWLCDKGRFFYEALDTPNRVTAPLVRKDGELVESSWPEALATAAAGLRRAVESRGPAAVAVLGGARLANEDAYAWARLAKGVLGTDNVDCQMGDGLPPELVLGLPQATIDEVCAAPAVVLLAPDLKEELPVLYLRLREAAVDGDVSLVEITPQRTGHSPHAAVTLLHRPGEAAVVARALVASDAPDDDVGGVSAPELVRAREVLSEAGSGVAVVLGRPSVAEGPHATVEAASVLADALPEVRFLPVLRRGNVRGALEMGLAPGLLPGRVSLDAGRDWFTAAWGAAPAAGGLDAGGILAAAADGRLDALVLLGADPVSDFPDRSLARQALEGDAFTVAVDLFLTPSSSRADVVLPAAGFGERAGTVTNIEGRVTRLGIKVTAPGTTRPDWMVAAELARRLGGDLQATSIDGLSAQIESLAPSHAGLTAEVLAQPANRDGLVVPLDRPQSEPEDRGVETVEVAAAEAQGETIGLGSGGAPLPRGEAPASPERTERPPMLGPPLAPPPRPVPPVDAYSSRLVSGHSLYDAGQMVARSPSLAALAAGPVLRVNPFLLNRLGVGDGERVRVSSSRRSLVVEIVGDPAVPRGSAVLPFNRPGEGAADLIDVSQPLTEVRVERVDSDGEAARG